MSRAFRPELRDDPAPDSIVESNMNPVVLIPARMASQRLPDKPLAALRTFLREFPDTTHRVEAVALLESLKTRLAKQRWRYG